jgi:hypothetical protein
VAVACLALALSCRSLRFDTPPPDRTEKTAKDPNLVLPSKKEFRLSQYVFFADFEIQRTLPLFQELADLRDQVYKELQLPSANTVVQVYLFEDRQRYERYMQARYPDLPKRRAFFVALPRAAGGPEDLLVYTYWGDRIRQDLRHELTHALLHSVLKDVPLWLDEGLAEYFEVPPENKQINQHHVEQLCRSSAGRCKPDLARLEQLSQVQQMAPAEYREAWAWVHMLLHDQPQTKAVLVGYLQQLRTTANPGPLRPRLIALLTDPERTFTNHLAALEKEAHPGSTVLPAGGALRDPRL